MGVSATHLDWTMVPYVRKSFYKHYKDGLKYIAAQENIELSLEPEEIADISIDNVKIYNHKMNYDYAMDMTRKEIYQAVEGMYHNLNTLQSRSGK